MTSASEKHMPSFIPPTVPDKSSKAADKAKPSEIFHAAKVRSKVSCAECGKPRAIYAAKALTTNEQALLQAHLDGIASFVCGVDDLGFKEGHPLYGRLYIRASNVCGAAVEKQYYSSKQFSSCCSWCGTTDPLELVDLKTLDLGGKHGYDICQACKTEGYEVVTFGKAVKTGGAAKTDKNKGAKRRKANGSSSTSAADEMEGRGEELQDEEDEEEVDEEQEVEEQEVEGADEEDDVFEVEIILGSRDD